MKDNKEVISEFNEYVNMTASELEKWLKSDDSNSAGWTKDGGEGESVGHDSGRKIVEILKSNPDKTPDKYTDDQLQHMRKVASYCKRHLAQESAGNKDKDPEAVKETKSYISLKNWGHDFLKAQGKNSGSANGGGGKSASKKKGEDKDEEDAASDEVEEDEGKKTGDKRKKSGTQNGSNKKRETRSTTSSKKNGSEDKDEGQSQDEEEEKEEEEKEEEEKKEGKNGKKEKAGKKEKEGKNGKEDKEKKEKKQDEEEEKEQDDQDDGQEDEDEEDDGKSGQKSSKKGPKKGETVSWKWGSGNPKGKVLDVKEDKYVLHTANHQNNLSD